MRKLIPMLFSTDMAQANMAMVKTETRRIVKPQPPTDYFYNGTDTDRSSGEDIFYASWEGGEFHHVKCPYGQPGDIMWMRETWAACMKWRWKTSIHMPLEACRYFAVIEEIKCERLQDITNAGAMAEGITTIDGETEAWPDFMYGIGSYATARGSYLSLWDKINGKGASDQNPWVWVVKYRRIGAAEFAAYRDEILASYKDYDKRDKINAAMRSCIKRMPLAVGGEK